MKSPQRKKAKTKPAPAKRKVKPARTKPKTVNLPVAKDCSFAAKPAIIGVTVGIFQEIFNAPGVGIQARGTTITLNLISPGGGGKVSLDPVTNNIVVKGGKATIQFVFNGTYYPLGIAFSKDGDRSLVAFRSSHDNFPNQKIVFDNQTLTVTDEWVNLKPDGVFEFFLIIQQDTGDIGISDPIITNEA